MTWERPYGAIRVTFTLASGSQRSIEACFRARSYFTIAKISLEDDDQSTVLADLPEGHRSKYSNDNLRPLVTLNESEAEMRQEVCIRSDVGSVTLYIEALSDIDAMVSGRVQLDYDITRFHSKSHDDMEGMVTLATTIFYFESLTLASTTV